MSTEDLTTMVRAVYETVNAKCAEADEAGDKRRAAALCHASVRLAQAAAFLREAEGVAR